MADCVNRHNRFGSEDYYSRFFDYMVCLICSNMLSNVGKNDYDKKKYSTI
jgi:hypothetical protein